MSSNEADDELARWAALFLSAQPDAPLTTSADSAADPRLTASAHALLRSVDAGGIPAFMTTGLRKIARDNGIDVTVIMTPNEVIEALRARLDAADEGLPQPRQE